MKQYKNYDYVELIKQYMNIVLTINEVMEFFILVLCRYIEEDDLMRFLKQVEIHTIFPLFEGAVETGKISKPAFRNWVVSPLYASRSSNSCFHQLDSLVLSLIGPGLL